ncbi:hypothetical protein Gotri_014322 [Gossypium trilobum]|uniref:Uncharacterized protein n=1 Tax=Gossypium trilobum TaxID=34281 RepID=A0A7J9DWI4_9ROSI|nr:hypothetical protein [Gossypium trilobum]
MSIVWRDIVENSKLEEVSKWIGSESFRLAIVKNIVVNDVARNNGFEEDFLISQGVNLDRNTKNIVVDFDFGVMLDCVPPPLEWMKFNVASFVLEDEAGCGEVLRDDKGMACMFFSGRIKARVTKMAEIIAIKTTMEMDIGSSPKAHVPLIIELCSFVASEWLANKSYRPWLLRKLFGDIDYGIKQLAQF